MDKSLYSTTKKNELNDSSTFLDYKFGDFCLLLGTSSTDTIKQICVDKNNSKLQNLLFLILDHCIDQIHIINKGKKNDISFEEDVINKQSELFIYDPLYDFNTGELFKDAFRKKQLAKLMNDSAKVKEFFIIICNELRDMNSFCAIKKMVNQIEIKKNEQEVLMNALAENLKMMQYIKNVINNQGKSCKKNLHQANQMYACELESVQDLLFEHFIRRRYIIAYENARQEQHNILCEREIRELQNIIAKYRDKIEKEIKVHTDNLNFITENQMALRIQIKQWIQKYNADIEESNYQNISLIDQQEKQEKDFEKLKILYAKHKKEIAEFKEYKRQKDKLDTEKQFKDSAATKIQAWWRGIMYRHQLGHYNPNKSQKKNNKKKKKK